MSPEIAGGLSAGDRVPADDIIAVIALRPATAVSPSDLARLVCSALPREIAAGGPQPRAVRVIVCPRNHEQKLGERQIRRDGYAVRRSDTLAATASHACRAIGFT